MAYRVTNVQVAIPFQSRSQCTGVQGFYSSYKSHHISSTLRSLYWRPIIIPQHISFKIISITFKTLQNNQPSYLSNLLLPYSNCPLILLVLLISICSLYLSLHFPKLVDIFSLLLQLSGILFLSLSVLL